MVQATESIYAAAPAQDLCFASPYAYGVLKPHSGLPIGGAELQLCTLAKALARHPGFRIALLTEYGRQRMVEREGAISIMTRALWGTARQRGAPAGPAEQSPTPPGLSVADRGRMLLRASPAPVAALLRAALRAGYRVVGAVRAVTQPGLAIARWITAIRATGAEIMVLRCATPHVGYARLASKLLGRKLVYMVAHEDEITGVYARRQSGGQWFEWGLTRADRVVCQHHEQGRLLARTYGKAAIILPSLRPCPIGGGDQSGRRVVLWIARFDTWKQPELLLDVAALFKDQPFVMVGPPSEATPGERTRLQDRIAALPNLRWIEHVPFERTLELFDDATVFVNTSLKEGFPNTFLQAAARGVPIVSWAINPDRVLDRFEFGFCAEGDRPTFEAQLRRLIADPDLRARLGENGRRYVAQFHDPNRIAEQYAALFRALVHGKGKVEARPAQTVTRKSAILKGNRALTE
jgi:glycosyltransferase involved in cell wall biosynthesis